METAPKIMIVEDLNITALDLKMKLTKLGCEVTAVTSSGEEAIQLAKKISPDLIVMDIKLKGKLDGIDAVKKIQARHEIPVIFLTAFGDAKTVQRANKMKPAGIIIKPYELVELRETLENVLDATLTTEQV